jgi:uncharacterized repeat protein (TIGR03803 family)
VTNLPFRKAILASIFCVMFAVCVSAQTFTTLANFGGTNGAQPSGPLIQSGDGSFFGTTNSGGTKNLGTIFSVTPTGTLTNIFSFDNSHGASPGGGLALQGNDTLHGTTASGGTSGDGTIYQIRGVTNKVTILHNFAGSDGQSPVGGLVIDVSQSSYGTTSKGGANGQGTIFQLSPTNALTTLYNFCAVTNCTDGSAPVATLVLDATGNLYGTTSTGGAHSAGTVFQLTKKNNKFVTLHSFCSQTNCTDGSAPLAGLVQATNGNLYGTTSTGGANGFGTVFVITSAGALTTLHSFAGTDGKTPSATLVLGTDGNFYGTTAAGGANGFGTAFEITSTGTFSTLHNFTGNDGQSPNGLVQGTDGTFYGTTSAGGANGNGTAFNLATGLAPFVELIPRTQLVGTLITIIGNDLTGANSVTFNGTPATFIIRSSGEVKAMVPFGATTGPVAVTTPTGTLLSNTYFQVIP